MSKAIEIFRHLEGTWGFKREISGEGKAEGKAFFRKSSTPLEFHYREDGFFINTKGEKFKTFREYIYRYENGTISVYFTDPPDKLLHTLIFFNSSSIPPFMAHAKHLCECDTYDATYQFDSHCTFTLTYAVKGPKKNYTIETYFEKNS